MTTLDLKSVKVAPGPADTLPYRTMLALMDAADRLGGEDPVLATPLSDQELEMYLRERHDSGEPQRMARSHRPNTASFLF